LLPPIEISNGFYRVPVAFLDNLEQIETLFPPLDDFDPGEPVASLD
jgi:hypothetical protein